MNFVKYIKNNIVQSLYYKFTHHLQSLSSELCTNTYNVFLSCNSATYMRVPEEHILINIVQAALWLCLSRLPTLLLHHHYKDNTTVSHAAMFSFVLYISNE